MTRARDELSAERRRLPMVQIAKDYRFEGPQGESGLLGRQEDWEEPAGRVEHARGNTPDFAC